MLKRRVVNPLVLMVLLVLMGLSFFVPVPWWAFALTILIWFLITLCGSFFVGWNYHLKFLLHNRNISEDWIALSFDDGPHPKYTPSVLELLKQHKAKASFFLIGQNAEKHPDIVRQIQKEGHCIGNHTYSHSKSFGFFSTEKVKEELSGTKSILQQITGLKTNFYRPAFGVTNPQIETAVKSLGLQSIGWSVRSLDTTPRSENMILRRITTRISKGDIILLHDTSEKSVAVLERLLVFLEEKNLQSVTVDRLLEIEPYG